MSFPGFSERVRPPSERTPLVTKFRVLAIDGGGIRGVIPAALLAYLEGLLATTLAQLRQDPAIAALWEPIGDPRIADCFHLIAGTSTGGLLTAGLTNTDPAGRPKLSAADAVAVYENHGAQIFHRSFLRRLLDPLNLFAPRYPLANLRTVLEMPSVLGPGALGGARTDLLITSYDTSVPALRLFTRWGSPDAPIAMIDAGLATAAAPTYFDPERLGRSRLVDGGVYSANPALAAISMALRRTEEPRPVEPREILMISLGTGAWERALDYGGGGIIGWLRPGKGGEALLEALLNGQSDFATEAAHMILNGWPATSLPGAPAGAAWSDPHLPPSSLGGGPQFWRYQALLPEPWALDDVSKVPALKRLATELAERHRDELARFAELLIRLGPVPQPSQAPP